MSPSRDRGGPLVIRFVQQSPDTLEIRAIEVTGNRAGDAPVLPGLPDQIPADQ